MENTRNQIALQAWSSDEAAEQYERARPAYAEAAVGFVVDEFGLGPGSRLLDLAAGTGKLTRQFVPYVGRIVAVEPLATMRAQLEKAVPTADIREGTAEAVPLPDTDVDAVVAGQAWHWFDSERALAEVTRVTRPGAGLALFWNEYDQRSELMSRIARIRDRVSAAAPRHTESEWRVAFSRSPVWAPLVEAEFEHVVRVTTEQMTERVLSSSVLAIQPEEVKSSVRAEIRHIAGGDTEIEVPYRTEVFWTRKG